MEGDRRPNRSDVHLSKEEEAKVEAATRVYFEGLAPKRHTKPQRSDYSKTYTDALSCRADDVNIPEHVQFQLLENDSQILQKLVYTNGSQETEEFVETEYYKDLNCIDKQHHMTGTGFISVENMKGKSFSLAPDSATDHHGSCKGNPATNEWIPAAAADQVDFISDKPKRSDN